MKKLLLVLIVTIMSSCYVPLEYDGEKKLITKGKVLDKNNNPISNIEVIVANQINKYGEETVFFFPTFGGFDDYQEIGVAKTNSNGEFVILNPAPINEDQTLIIINSKAENGIQQKTYYNIYKSDYKNYKLDIGAFQLFKTNDIVTATIFFNKINPNNRIINIKFTGNLATNTVSYNTILDTSSDDLLLANREIQVTKNQTIIIEYKLINTNTNVSEVLQKEILVQNQNLNFTLNY